MQERSLSSLLPQNILYFKDEHENSMCPCSTSGLKQQAVKQRHRDAGGRGGKISILNRCVQCEKTEAYYVCMTMSSIFLSIIIISNLNVFFLFPS